jgi:transglutaminase-like putative cysteine protease
MANFSIRHATVYLYRRPVQLGVHRLQLRPRENRDIRILAMDLVMTPPGPVTWAHDVFGNAIASATFAAPTDRLTIESRVTLEHNAAAYPQFAIAGNAASFPFAYALDEVSDLGALMIPQFVDPAGRLPHWAQGFIRSSPTNTLALLKDINDAILAWVDYEAREDEGTQSPLVTLDRRRGSCRDIAVLMIEAVRWLGFGARIVSGYLINRNTGMVGTAGTGSTHAWVEIYLPGAGWIAFDPTNRTVGDFSVIPIAVARDIKQAVPVSGSYAGDKEDFLSMTVEVSVY